MSMKLSALLNPSEDTKSMKTTSAPHQSPTTSPVEQQSARRSSSSEVPQTSPVYGSRRDGIQYHQNAFDAASALAALAAGPPAAKSGSIYSESSLLYGVKSDAKSDERIEETMRPEPVVNNNDASAMKMEDDTLEEKMPQVNDEPALPDRSQPEPQDSSQPEPPLVVESPDPDVDKATKAAILQAQNEYSMRTRPPSRVMGSDPTASPPPEPPSSPQTWAPPTKKRPPPKSTTSSNSKPPGTKKPPPKRLKLGPSDDAGTRASQARSATPSSVTGKTPKTVTPVARKSSKSATPATVALRSPEPPAADEDAGSESDSGAVYCICRKPDNHTWMIGCDGPCDDWYHAKCVHMNREDEDLLDKYYCPGCMEKGVGVTTWKPMCRRDGCRQPARLRKGQESKYCSEDCGLAFMRETLGRAGALNYTPRRRRGSKSKGGKTKSQGGGDDSDSEPDIGPLGGPIRTHELKTLVSSVPDIDTFRRLGSSGIPTPPPTASPEESQKKDADKDFQDARLTKQEQHRLGEISARKAQLRERRALLKDRERFVVLAKERAARSKDCCGFDSRLSWDDRTFEVWRHSGEGKAAFERGSLDAGAEAEEGNKLKPRPAAAGGQGLAAGGEADGFCRMKPKRCSRHGVWQKGALQDVRFEEADVGDEMRRIDREERDIRGGAMVRARMREGVAGVWGGQEDEGGWVEICDGDVDVDVDVEG